MLTHIYYPCSICTTEILFTKDCNILYLWEEEHLESLEIPSTFFLEGLQLLQSAPAVIHVATEIVTE